MANCNEESITPVVDNTLTECTECGFFNSTCIINKHALAYLGLPPNSTVKDFEDKVIKKLIFLSKEIKELKDRVTILETP